MSDFIKRHCKQQKQRVTFILFLMFRRVGEKLEWFLRIFRGLSWLLLTCDRSLTSARVFPPPFLKLTLRPESDPLLLSQVVHLQLPRDRCCRTVSRAEDGAAVLASCAKVSSHESGCTRQVLPVTRAVAVVGPAPEASSYIPRAPADLRCSAPWINRGTSMASGPPGRLKLRREAAADTRRDRRAPPAPPACSWWDLISVWARRSAVGTLASWSSVSWGHVGQLDCDFFFCLFFLPSSVFFLSFFR